MTETQPATLKITFQMADGLPGRDDDPKNPISRALMSLMKENTLLPTFTQAFLIDDADSQPWRWLGVFVRSAGNRILFFPGFKEEIIRVRGSRGEELKFDRPFKIDHISLERDRGSWHITTARSNDHQGGPPAADLGGRPSSLVWDEPGQHRCDARVTLRDCRDLSRT